MKDHFFGIRPAARLTLGLGCIAGCIALNIPSHHKPSQFTIHLPFSHSLAQAGQPQVVDAGRLVYTLSGHTNAVNSVAIADNKTIISGSTDRTIRLWNLETGKLIRTLSGNLTVNGVVASPDSQTFLNSGTDKTVKLWRTHSGDLLRTFSGFSAMIRAVAIDPDGQRFATASIDRRIRIVELLSGDEIGTLTGHTDYVTAVAFSPDRSTLVSSGGGADRTLRIWQLPDKRTRTTGKLLHTIQGHFDWVLSVAISPNGRYVASASADKTIKLWDLSS